MEKKENVAKAIDYLFGIRKEILFLILIFLLAFTLRLIAAINLPVTADDMHHVTYAINFYGADRLITYEQSAGLWHAFTSVIYEWFGTTQLASRLAALIFGSFSVLALYLLTKEFFDEKISLLAAFLLAIAPFHIKNTMAEMDVMAMFFVLVSMYLFVKAVKSDKFSFYAPSGIFLGLAIYTKVYPLLFVPSYMLYFAFVKKKTSQKIVYSSNLKKIFLFLAIAAVFAIPTLTHNYLLYKDKGFLDLQFTRTLNLGKNNSAQYYSWDPIFNKDPCWACLFRGDNWYADSNLPWSLIAIDFIRQGDPINFYLGILGLFFVIFSKKPRNNYLSLFLFSILFIFPFLVANILLAKHYLFLEIFLVPLSALSVCKINDKISQSYKKDALKIILLILLVISLIWLGLPKTPVSHFYGKSHISQMIDFKENSIPKNALIVSDNRMYTGRTNWAFHGRPYLSGTDFIGLLNAQDEIPGNATKVELYFFECLLDDCGWGTIKDQPELNKTMEDLANSFKQIGGPLETFKEPVRSKAYYPFLIGEKEKVVAVYKADLMIKEEVLFLADQPKNWWLYDIGFLPKGRQFDYYDVYGFFDSFLNKLAHWIVTLALVLAFISPFYLIYLLIKK